MFSLILTIVSPRSSLSAFILITSRSSPLNSTLYTLSPTTHQPVQKNIAQQFLVLQGKIFTIQLDIEYLDHLPARNIARHSFIKQGECTKGPYTYYVIMLVIFGSILDIKRSGFSSHITLSNSTERYNLYKRHFKFLND